MMYSVILETKRVGGYLAILSTLKKGEYLAQYTKMHKITHAIVYKFCASFYGGSF